MGEERRTTARLSETQWLNPICAQEGKPYSASRIIPITNSFSASLKEFHLFPKLPTELRFKIYRYAMLQRRLIELEWGPNMSVPTGIQGGSHQWVRVCPRSCQPPALLHVCQESREEAKTIYQLRCFDTKVAQHSPNSPKLHEHYVYYNPKADIVFFGEHTCVSTYIRVFAGKIDDIPAIAIVNSGKGELCCDHDDDIYGVNGGVDTLQALHGFDPSVTLHNHRYGGCPGLKEVFIVVKSKLWQYKQGEVDSSVTLRPATNEGLTRGQMRFKSSLEHEIALVETETPMPRVGENIWTGDAKPTFQFVSFANVLWGVDSREPDGLTVSRSHIRKLSRDNWEFIKRTEAITGCEISIPDEEYRGEDPREISFRGVRKSIEAAKQAIVKKLVSELLHIVDDSH
jgi:2EXR family/KH domain